VSTHPFDLKFVVFYPKFSGRSFVKFQKKTISGEFFRNLAQTKAIFYQNLWNFALLSAILFWVRNALKKFTQVLSYVFWTQVRSHVHKEIIKRRYGEEKPRHFVFGKPVLFTLGLGLTTLYSLGILVWNFYQTVFTVFVDYSLRFEPQIHPTRLVINFLFITANAERKARLCVKLFYFLMGEYSFVLPKICRVLFQIQWILLRGISGKKLFWENFSEIWHKTRLSYTKTCEISPYFLQFYSGSVLPWKNPDKYFHMLFAPR